MRVNLLSLQMPSSDVILANCCKAIEVQNQMLLNPEVSNWVDHVALRLALAWATEVMLGLTRFEEGPSLGGACVGCHALTGDLEIHHYPVPKRLNGPSNFKNTVLLCSNCHTQIEPTRN